METNTLTPEQIQSWRKIIYFQLESKIPGTGIYALVMPESEVIVFWQKMKNMVENIPLQANHAHQAKPVIKKCTHSNSITGQNGKYCIDCEKYV